MENADQGNRYAKQQIDEANRRLDNIKEIVTVDQYEWVSKDGETTITLPPGQEPDGTDFENIVEVGDTVFNVEGFEENTTTHTDEELIGSHIQNIIIDCQLCIELAVKSMFKLVNKDHPFSHSISFGDGRTQGFYSEIPDGFTKKDKIVRVIFLTQFWGEFYELAKYGAPTINVRPEMIFTTDDASRAIKDAEFCIEVAQELLNFTTENTSTR